MLPEDKTVYIQPLCRITIFFGEILQNISTIMKRKQHFTSTIQQSSKFGNFLLNDGVN